jgi:hypothetical protein
MEGAVRKSILPHPCVQHIFPTLTAAFKDFLSDRISVEFVEEVLPALEVLINQSMGKEFSLNEAAAVLQKLESIFSSQGHLFSGDFVGALENLWLALGINSLNSNGYMILSQTPFAITEPEIFDCIVVLKNSMLSLDFWERGSFGILNLTKIGSTLV